MNNFWENQRQFASLQLAETAGAVGRDIASQWKAKSQGRQLNERVRQAYKEALEVAKETGDMQEEFQATVPIDQLGKQIGIKAVALRELKKTSPGHPLVVSETAREVIGQVTLVNYNRADRPVDEDGVANYSEHVPDEETTERIYEAYPGPN
jgi:hypothetical protein